MSKLRMLSGLPASGKSTVAREYVADGWFRVNRDELRAQLYPGASWSGKREDLVRSVERAQVRDLLSHNLSVIIDDTNLMPSHRASWSQLAGECNATFETQAVNTPTLECIRRDSLRNGPAHVGESVIWKMATSSGLYRWDAPNGDTRPIVIVDVDGTLADGTHREHLLADKTDPDRWAKYFRAAYGDVPYPVVTSWVVALQSTYRIIIVSGRPDNFKLLEDWTMAKETSSFIRHCGITPTAILMRASSDKRPDVDVKADILHHNLLNAGAQIAFVLDDRPSVIRMWRECGLTCYPVRGDVEEF